MDWIGLVGSAGLHGVVCCFGGVWQQIVKCWRRGASTIGSASWTVKIVCNSFDIQSLAVLYYRIANFILFSAMDWDMRVRLCQKNQLLSYRAPESQQSVSSLRVPTLVIWDTRHSDVSPLTKLRQAMTSTLSDQSTPPRGTAYCIMHVSLNQRY